MTLVGFFILFFIVLLLASLFSYGLKRSGAWGGFWGMLLILFLVGWAARVWIVPTGPVFWGYTWLPIGIGIVVFLALLLFAAAPPRTSYRQPPTAREDAETYGGLKGLAASFSVLFWLLLIVLVIAIIVGYLRQ